VSIVDVNLMTGSYYSKYCCVVDSVLTSYHILQLFFFQLMMLLEPLHLLSGQATIIFFADYSTWLYCLHTWWSQCWPVWVTAGGRGHILPEYRKSHSLHVLACASSDKRDA